MPGKKLSEMRFCVGVALFFCHGIMQVSSQGTCPANWLTNTYYCYFFSNDTARTYASAESYCSQFGSDLVEITSDVENAYVLANGPVKTSESYWIGYKRVSGSLWRWPSGTIGSTLKWDQGEPDNDGDCARMVQHNSGSWRDFDCAYKLQWACRKYADCGAVPSAANVEANVTFTTAVSDPSGNGYYALGTVAVQTCEPGHEFFSGASTNSIQCDINSQWANVQACDTKRCQDPPTYELASMNDTAKEFGTVIGYTCAQGYWFSPSQENMTLTLYCAEDKTWVGSVNDCRKKECERPITGNAVATSSSNVLGIKVIYTCYTGYRFQGINDTVREYECGPDGWLPKPVLLCIVRTCPFFSVQGTTNIPDTQNFGVTVAVTCNPGMRYSDTTTVKYTKCLETEEWETVITDYCRPIPCKGVPGNSTNVLTDFDPSREYFSGEQVNYTCIPDFFFTNGEKTRFAECNEVGEWEPLSVGGCIGEAVEIATAHYHVAEEGEGASTFGSIALLIIGILLIGVVIFDLATLSKHLVKLRTNLNCMNGEENEDPSATDGLISSEPTAGQPGAGQDNSGYSGQHTDDTFRSSTSTSKMPTDIEV